MLSTWKLFFYCICMSNGEYLKTLFLLYLYEQRWWVPRNVIFDCICMSNDDEYLKTLFLTVFVWATMVNTSKRYFWLYLYEQRWWVPQNVIFDSICMSNNGEYLKTLFLTVFVWATMVLWNHFRLSQALISVKLKLFLHITLSRSKLIS